MGGSGDHDQKRRFETVAEAISHAEDGDKIFVEPGRYCMSSACFLHGKGVSLIGADSDKCILEYGRGSAAGVASKLDTFLICSTENSVTLLKRLTFRAITEKCSKVKNTRFLGVGAGSVHVEDCVFDGAEKSSDVDAIYASAKICGSLADRYPPPKVINY